MSIPVRTGRVCASHGCRWCGQGVDTVVYEVCDAGKLGDEVMCCVCGKHQYRWGESTCARKAGEYAEKDRQWQRDAHNEFLRDIAPWLWLAAQIIRLAAPPEPMSPEQAAWVRENVWPPSWLRSFNHIPGTFLDCACQRPPSCECQRDWHAQCRHDGHPVNETVIQTSSLRPARFPEPYAHYSPVTSGRNVLAWVWPAGAPCREICTCVCHRARPADRTAPARPQQLDLFTGVP